MRQNDPLIKRLSRFYASCLLGALGVASPAFAQFDTATTQAQLSTPSSAGAIPLIASPASIPAAAPPALPAAPVTRYITPNGVYPAPVAPAAAQLISPTLISQPQPDANANAPIPEPAFGEPPIDNTPNVASDTQTLPPAAAPPPQIQTLLSQPPAPITPTTVAPTTVAPATVAPAPVAAAPFPLSRSPAVAAQLITLPIEKEKVPQSVFYTAAEIHRLRVAMSAYIKVTNGREQELTAEEAAYFNQVNTSGKPQPVMRHFTYPQFFLESVAYHSPSDWTVWMNSYRFTPTLRQTADLTLLGIQKEKITILWHPHEMNKVRETWAKVPHESAELDLLHNTVTFTLKPNQTFSSYTMSVLEGKVTPITIQISENAPSGDMPSFDLPPEVVPIVPQPQDNTGLHGLLNRYQQIQDKHNE